MAWGTAAGCSSRPAYRADGAIKRWRSGTEHGHVRVIRFRHLLVDDVRLVEAALRTRGEVVADLHGERRALRRLATRRREVREWADLRANQSGRVVVVVLRVVEVEECVPLWCSHFDMTAASTTPTSTMTRPHRQRGLCAATSQASIQRRRADLLPPRPEVRRCESLLAHLSLFGGCSEVGYRCEVRRPARDGDPRAGTRQRAMLLRETLQESLVPRPVTP